MGSQIQPLAPDKSLLELFGRNNPQRGEFAITVSKGFSADTSKKQKKR